MFLESPRTGLSDMWLCMEALPVSVESQTEQALESRSLNKQGMRTALSYGKSRADGVMGERGL